MSSAKIFVAVHGIGDQIGYEAVQAVATCVARYYGTAPAVPLGHFYPATSSPNVLFKPMPRLMRAPDDPAALVGLGFAEVYWGPIAREPATAGFVLEEAKKWARTISARIALRAGQTGLTLPVREQHRLVTVLDQLIETVFLLERLSYLPAKAGFYQFNLRRLLVDFLGDVQVVADFQAYRHRIISEFDDVMGQAAALLPADCPPELYIVAHSEGTVVTFLALLNALAEPDRHPWIRLVRGLMTIGSPIESHHLLWPELWQHAGADRAGLRPDPSAPRGIPWQNYFDRGDPIAYPLIDTRAWLNAQGFSDHLVLDETAFSRSLLPGKAHTDYWQDEAVFGRFFETVVKLDRPATGASRSYADPPRDRLAAMVTNFAVPQGLIFMVLMAATYVLYRPVSAILYPGGLPSVTIARDVIGIGVLLLGITAAGRLPRLTHEWRWWLLSAVLLALAMPTYANVTCAGTRRQLGLAFANWAPLSPVTESRSAERWWAGVTMLPECDTDRTARERAVKAIADRSGAVSSAEQDAERETWQVQARRATAGVMMVAGLLALVAGTFASWSPYWGVRLLPGLGVVSAFALVLVLLAASPASVELWPVILGAGLFFYLWWLATLLFDLVFVWQRYVRQAAAQTRVSELSRKGYTPTPLERAIDQRVGSKRGSTSARP